MRILRRRDIDREDWWEIDDVSCVFTRDFVITKELIRNANCDIEKLERIRIMDEFHSEGVDYLGEEVKEEKDRYIHRYYGAKEGTYRYMSKRFNPRDPYGVFEEKS